MAWPTDWRSRGFEGRNQGGCEWQQLTARNRCKVVREEDGREGREGGKGANWNNQDEAVRALRIPRHQHLKQGMHLSCSRDSLEMDCQS